MCHRTASERTGKEGDVTPPATTAMTTELFGEEPDKIYDIVEELGRGLFALLSPDSLTVLWPHSPQSAMADNSVRCTRG